MTALITGPFNSKTVCDVTAKPQENYTKFSKSGVQHECLIHAMFIPAVRKVHRGCVLTTGCAAALLGLIAARSPSLSPCSACARRYSKQGSVLILMTSPLCPGRSI